MEELRLLYSLAKVQRKLPFAARLQVSRLGLLPSNLPDIILL